MRDALAGHRIILGLSGGVACYKLASVASALAQASVAVDVAMTDAAQRLAAVLTVQSAESEGYTHTLRGEGDDFVTQVIHVIAREGIQVKGFRTEVPTLEAVFLKLTGHGVRD